jgi:hypothetical protein
LFWVATPILLLCFLGFHGSGRFLDRVCGLSLFTLAYQAQFDEALPKLAVVHDSSLQPEAAFTPARSAVKLESRLRGFDGHPQNP